MNMLIPTAVATPSNSKNMGTTNAKGSMNATKTGDSFGQVLGQSLNGQAVTESSAQTPALTLQGTLNNALGNETSGENTLDQLIAQLIASLQEVDDKLAGSDDLLQQLQAWLAQANALLQTLQSNQGEASHTATLVPTDTDLTLHPATIRFTVQDKLMQLLALVKDDNEGVTMDMRPLVSGQAKVQSDFIQTLQAALNQASVETSVPSTGAASTTQIAQVSQMIQALQHILNQANPSKLGDQVQTLEGDVDAAFGAQVTDGLKQAVSDRSSLLQQQMSNQTQSESDETDAASNPGNAKVTDDVPDVFTAGQMALRTQDAPLVKTTPQVVVAQNFAPEMSNFIKQLDITKLNGISEAKIILFPEHLGQVDIRISIQNGQIMAQFMTEHAQAKDMLDNQMVQLRAALQSQGLQVDKLEVTQNQNLHSQMYHEQRQPNGGQRQGEQQNKNRITGKEDQTNSGMISELGQEPTIRVNGLGYGSSFTASV
ncbi:hypothetical protein BVG16_14215 [Paenibacillus selenitireducens]|uniref:Flagellar hook-length control protein-like C-terminal domain-containing protein n=1 Tax=Paenibacillus selenitireducens TaxID=1324314 RepID=A0A1T2XCF6_9BACL|nr:flagellar hook-length control protein FliK [Paenibacillus selenitireducens]OPA77597.1 hypothetical protein BVG16_14215 [Paenibacillus selenitireducens]